MKIDVVFSGGGVKAVAFIGAIQVVEENGFEFERYAGTSAGAITAALLAAGYSSEELTSAFKELQMNKLLDPPKWSDLFPLTKWISLYFRMGLYKGNKLENWIQEKLAVKGIYTFSDLPKDNLKIVASDLTLGRILLLPDDLERFYQINPDTFSIATAVRMSSGLPFFFMPEKINGKNQHKSLIVDGGILSNFPLWVFLDGEEKRKRPILGMKLSASMDFLPERKITNAIEMFHALFSTMMDAHDARYISKAEAADIIFIPVQNVTTTNFDISIEQKKQLIQLGRSKAESFLRSWSR